MTIPTLAQMLTLPRGRCIFDPSGIERIAFDMLAMLFLLYDLCLHTGDHRLGFPHERVVVAARHHS